MIWARKLLRVVERMRAGGELMKDKLARWLKEQISKYDAGMLPARYRHVVEEVGKEGVWG